MRIDAAINIQRSLKFANDRRQLALFIRHSLRIPFEAVGIAERSGRQAFGQIELGPFVIVAMNREDIANRQLLVRGHRKWIGAGKRPFRPRRQTQGRCGQRLRPPYPAQRIVRMMKLAVPVNPGEVQRAAFRRPPAFCPGNFKDIRRIHHIFGIGPNVTDAELVGGHKHLIVRHPLRHPDAAGAIHIIAGHFHDPAFMGIRHQQRFARAVVAILFDQFAHEPDGFARGFRPLQRYAGKLGRIKNPFPRFRLRVHFRFIGALADGKLMFVHDAVIGVKIGVRVRDLRNVAERHAGRDILDVVIGTALLRHDAMADRSAPLRFEVQRRVRIIDGPHGARLVILRRNINHAGIVQSIIRMGNHDRSIRRGRFAYEYCRAGQGRLRHSQAKDQQDRNHCPFHR